MAIAIPVFSNVLAQGPAYTRWLVYSTDELMKKGREFDNRSMADSAIVCYTVVANRYDKKMSAEEKEVCAEAYVNLWSVYFLAYLDYIKSYECLAKAQDIYHEIDKENPRIDIGMGGMYATIGDLCKDVQMNINALSSFRKAFWVTSRSGDLENLNIAFANLIDRAYSLDSLSTITNEWNTYLKQPQSNDLKEYSDYNKLLYHGLNNLKNGNFNEARNDFQKQVSSMPFDSRHLRFLCLSHLNIADTYTAEKNFTSALSSLKTVESMTDSFKLHDIKMEVLHRLSDVYSSMGNKNEAIKVQNRYLALKDSMLNYQQLKNMSNLQFMTELDKMERKMQETRQHKREQDLIMLGIIIIALAIAVFLFILFRKNRKMLKRNKALYLKNVELMEMEGEYNKLKKSIPISPTAPTSPTATTDKYKGSNLTEESKNELLQKIIDVMENDEAIFSPGFSVEQLSTLVGYRSKLVSQVINETYDYNFNNLLNQYRIKEALRRINDSNAIEKFTVEGISSEVGFKSRTSFTTAFKRVTGLSPSEYFNQLKHQRREKV